MQGTDKESPPESASEVSPVDAKLRRIEELAEQIAHEDERLASFWLALTERLGSVEVEVWSDDLLDFGAELIFDEARVEDELSASSSGEKGLQLGFCADSRGRDWRFRVRPACVTHGSTIYSSLEKPEPAGESRALSREPRAVQLAALRQLPELLDCAVGSLNDTLAVVHTALGDPVEVAALVSSPFSHRGQTPQASVIRIGLDKAADPEDS